MEDSASVVRMLLEEDVTDVLLAPLALDLMDANVRLIHNLRIFILVRQWQIK